jgi:hypothetical protein
MFHGSGRLNGLERNKRGWVISTVMVQWRSRSLARRAPEGFIEPGRHYLKAEKRPLLFGSVQWLAQDQVPGLYEAGMTDPKPIDTFRCRFETSAS